MTFALRKFLLYVRFAAELGVFRQTTTGSYR